MKNETDYPMEGGLGSNGSPPTVSVIMPVYNSERYISDSVGSILKQSYSDFEFLIVDDASWDGTERKLRECSDTRVKVIRNDKNLGVTASLNRGIQNARGRYIARMDADDIAAKDRIGKQVDYLENSPSVDVVFGHTVLIDKDSEIICESWRPDSVEEILLRLSEHNFIPHPTVMFRKSVIEEAGSYDEAFRTGQDLELWIRLRDRGYCFGYIRDALLYFRLNPDSVREDRCRNYWFKVANYCIWNKAKIRSLKYCRKLSVKEGVIICAKVLIPGKFHEVFRGWLR